jgi:multisubunit Na+/H+ antiporter MnhC subunit
MHINMFKKLDIKATLIAGGLAALLFCIPAFIYLRNAYYPDTWLLYLGSFFFLVVIWLHTMRENKKRGFNESTVAMIFNSHMATITGVLISAVVCFLLLIVMVPGFFSRTPDKELTGEPANMITGATDGLAFQVFLAAIVINFTVGSFAGIVLPFYEKRNQTKDRREPTPFHQKGTK